MSSGFFLFGGGTLGSCEDEAAGGSDLTIGMSRMRMVVERGSLSAASASDRVISLD